MPLALQAGFWGLLSGSALVIGALIAWFAHVPQRIIAAVMAFGSGVLISALSFELMDEAYRAGGFDAASAGFLSGAAVYTAANIYLSRRGARHRKRSGEQQPSDEDTVGSRSPCGGAVSWVAVIVIFLSNVPEGLSSVSGMKKAGRSRRMFSGS